MPCHCQEEDEHVEGLEREEVHECGAQLILVHHRLLIFGARVSLVFINPCKQVLLEGSYAGRSGIVGSRYRQKEAPESADISEPLVSSHYTLGICHPISSCVRSSPIGCEDCFDVAEQCGIHLFLIFKN